MRARFALTGRLSRSTGRRLLLPLGFPFSSEAARFEVSVTVFHNLTTRLAKPCCRATTVTRTACLDKLTANPPQNTLKHVFAHDMSMTVNHTWSHNIDNQEVRYIGFDQMVGVRGSANADLRQRVTITMSWDLPFGRKSNQFYNRAIRNWRVNALGTIRSGYPFSVTQASGRTNGGTGTDRPD